MIYDLDYVSISGQPLKSWMESLEANVLSLKRKYPDLTEDEIPDEQFQYFPETGDGELFIQVRDVRIWIPVRKENFIINS